MGAFSINKAYGKDKGTPISLPYLLTYHIFPNNTFTLFWEGEKNNFPESTGSTWQCWP